ncbi:CPBP family intramembrane metalloprotease [Halorarum halophilum]|uniref:CPBP family intramembrane metalloprotease n=1 Tax=Halorarum halophilum TaxID=2743090 RepID=A0A7D5K5T8_9EURY|nr:CPBP family intramembrane glutamic endopeptidase [Halobaculum halophilum]QLG26214.1 CPBP family intramembrane metalloprotease [Halobaculum halophilum]
MPDWTTFAGLAGVVLALLLALAHLTQSQLTGGTEHVDAAAPSDSGDAADRGSSGTSTSARNDFSPEEWRWGTNDVASAEVAEVDDSVGSVESERLHVSPDSSPEPSVADLPKPALLVNAALSQALFGAVLAVAAWWTGIPHAALGLAPDATPRFLGLGVVLGLALWLANELAGRAGTRFGFEGGEELRALLAPETPGEWVLLLAGVLPVVALVEEFLFRAALVGALGAGFGVQPWLLVVGSSVAFALGHGAQGRAGMLVTGVLGLVFGAAFVLTGSLLVVVVAHYLVNALEFVVHEGLDRGTVR